MSLTQEQIEKLSKRLSKLGIENKKKITSDLNEIIGYIDILNEVDTEGVKATVSVVSGKNVLRNDILEEKENNVSELLQCSNRPVVGEQIAIANIMK